MYATKMISPEKEEVTFNQAVLVEGVAVELWLLRVEGMMKETLCRALFATYNSLKSTKKEGLERWIRDCKGQMQITAAQINWTFEVERVLTELGKGNLPAKKKPMKSLYKKWKVWPDCPVHRDCVRISCQSALGMHVSCLVSAVPHAAVRCSDNR